ncbi:molybdate ABC transporter permease subunit [Pseudalkalibacillus caeni]|uniref:Molybdenum transport system permease n=1 Tax=Exobacillus caeni TaxID=2574798 RepID=A0A5R9FDB6_9BACL|nr:molybdate ABC transporter permease subunit [Pseudalkalibacillus caeni]TLS38873.1 molybdate ABC transporter permease subunit [Pseudalkalibacillus caeni]
MFTGFWEPVQLSIEVACVSSILVIITGLTLSRVMARKQFKAKALIETLLLLPLVLPPSVVGFILIVVFGNNSPVGKAIEWTFGQSVIFTWWAAVIAASIVSFPLMYQSAKSGFEAVDKQIEDASRIDGAGELKVFWFISIPLAYKAIIAGFILSFTRALGEFGATLMFAGNIPGKTQTIPTAIYIAIDAGNMELAWLWVLMTVGISFLMLMSTYLIK